jgi:hypothetical protein
MRLFIIAALLTCVVPAKAPAQRHIPNTATIWNFLLTCQQHYDRSVCERWLSRALDVHHGIPR